MRAFEFYQQKNLLEQESSQVKQQLQRIATNVEKNPASAAKVADMLSAMNDAADQIVSLKKETPATSKPVKKIAPPSQIKQPQPEVESLDEATDSNIQKVKAQANELSGKADNMILALGVNPKDKAILLKMLQEIEQETLEKKYTQDVERETIQGDAVSLLAGKVTGTLEKIRDHYIHKSAQRKAMLDQQPGAVADYEKTLDRGRPNKKTVETEIGTLLHGTLEWWRRKTKSREARKEFDEASLKFLKACQEGIIDLGTLLSKGSGNFLEEIPGEYSWVRESKLADQLLNLKPSGSGAGNWGPGELGLAILGKPVNKDSSKGDLVVGDKKFELKASANAKSGGRINTEAIMVGKDGQVDFMKAWDSLRPKLNIKMNGEKIAFANPDEVPKGMRKEISQTSIGPTWIAIVNSALRGSKVNSSELGSFLGEVLTAPISPSFKSKVKYNTSSLVSTQDGFPQINGQNVLGEYLKQALTFYNETDGVDDILVVNPSDGHFEVINATDAKGLQKKINTGAIQTSTTWIDFKDKQSKASPQLGTKGPK